MIPTSYTPPEHYSAEIAYRALKPLRPVFDNYLPLLQSGVTAKTLMDFFRSVKTIRANMKDAYDAGKLDGSPTWKANVNSALNDLTTLWGSVQSIEKKYSGLVGNEVSSQSALGNILTMEEAAELVSMSQPDVNSLKAAINGILQ